MTLLLFYYSNFYNSHAKRTTLLLIVTAFMHLGLSYIGFYKDFEAMPPRFPIVLLPAAIILFLHARTTLGNKYQSRRNLQLTTLLHAIRIPIEIILLQLFLHHMIPQLMTFEGRNFDILIGLTAPIIALLYHKQIIGYRGLLIWNIIGLLFVLNIVIHAILSLPSPFQQMAFDQPNLAVLYTPFVLLPGIVVPIVIYTHIIDILYLRKALRA